MTTTEFSNEFDILYNGIASNTAPPLDLYEKSVYLTKAQLEIVKNYFNPKGNKYNDGFEKSEKRRRDLNELVKPYVTSISITSPYGLSKDSQFFRIPNDTFLIVQEQTLVASQDACVNNTYLSVVPKTHDEYNVQVDNPFRKPGVWRIDAYSQVAGGKAVELISPYTITEYKCRYVKYPAPIVLTDLATTFPSESLSIDGVTDEQTCELSISIHREILDRAVELALADYKPENLQLKAQMNLRNE